MTLSYRQWTEGWKARWLGLAAALVVGAAGDSAPAIENAATVREALDAVREDRLQEYVDYVAHDAFEGREAGGRGGRVVAETLAEHLRSAGLRPRGDKGLFFQRFGDGYRNILGVLEGSDPLLKNQIVVVHAHYDHIGFGKRQTATASLSRVHNGADDNASGVAALVHLAETLSCLTESPKRSVLFALWDAEEKGLLGSRHWVAHPTVPLANLRFALDFDMVGRLREEGLIVAGTRSGMGLRRRITELNEAVDLRLRFSWKSAPIADYFPFLTIGVPSVLFHTGDHADYHRPSDTADRVNFAGMRRVTQLALLLVRDAADCPTPIEFREASTRETDADQRALLTASAGPNVVGAGDSGPATTAPPRFGILWRVDEAEPTVVVVTAVLPGYPAEKAGVLAGDRVLRIAGCAFAGEEEFMRLAARATDAVELSVERDGRLQRMRIDAVERRHRIL